MQPRGVGADEVLAEIARLRQADAPTHGGRLFAYVYDPAVAGLDELALAAHGLSAHVNGLNPTTFPSLLSMENALVGAAAALLGGGPDGVDTVVGNLTSGGTESLILAVKAARDAHPSIDNPSLVLPTTAHPSLIKACSYLRVSPVRVPVDPVTLRPTPAEVAAAIGPETVLVACSAPSYAHGVVDPVAAIADVALDRGVRCHVDACFGGWLLPFLRRLGAPVPAFDFAVPGVTSISVDLHKYAYAPKGVSVLLHRSAQLRAPQYFAYADWPGYTVVNPTIASTRPGGPIAGAYATLRFLGDAGYLDLAARTLESVRVLRAMVAGIAGLRLLSDEAASVVTFASDDPALDLFVVADELAERGWHVQPQLAWGELPRTLHLTVTPSVSAADVPLAAAVASARAAGPTPVDPNLAALAAALTPADLTPPVIAEIAGMLGVVSSADGSPLPTRQAAINTLVEAAAVPVREALFAGFLSLLQRPTF